MRRRSFTIALAVSLATPLAGFARGGRASALPEDSRAAFERGIEAIEAQSGGRIGVAMLDTATGQRFEYRADERFTMCSTFKMLAAALVLHRGDRREEDLERRIRFDASALVTYSPVTGTRVGGNGMSLAELCEAAITPSSRGTASRLGRRRQDRVGLARHLQQHRNRLAARKRSHRHRGLSHRGQGERRTARRGACEGGTAHGFDVRANMKRHCAKRCGDVARATCACAFIHATHRARSR